MDAGAGVVAGVFFAGEVFDVRQEALSVLGGSSGIVAEGEIRDRGIVVINHGVS